MTINQFAPFSESPDGKPIAISSSTSPGVLIHQNTNSEMDAIWLWASVGTAFSYTKSVYIRLVKGTTGNYVSEIIKLPAGRKFLIENGIIITGNIELRAYIDTTLTTVTPTPQVLFTGYVHRRI